MKNLDLKEEKYLDIEKLIHESLSDQKLEEEKEDLVLEYLCQSVSKYDSYDVIKKRVQQGEPYAYLKLASWHIDHAKNIKDYCIAYKYACKAEQMGYVEANYLLGQLYFYGTGCQKDMYRARKCFLKFIENVNPKYLLNEAVLADAYLKLAEIEKEKMNFAKTAYYFHRLHEFNREYDSYIEECENEMKTKKSENIQAIIQVTMGFISFCACTLFLFHYLKAESVLLYENIPKKNIITVVESVEIAEESVPLDMRIIDVLPYYEIEEDIFLQSNYSTVPITHIEASSTYISKKGKYYGTDNLIDYRSDTCWQEGVRDAGVGQSITFHIPENSAVQGFMIENGNSESIESYEKNNRVASLIINNDIKYHISLKDEMGKKYFIFDEPVIGNSFTIRIDSVYSGNTYNDTCISQLVLYE